MLYKFGRRDQILLTVLQDTSKCPDAVTRCVDSMAIASRSGMYLVGPGANKYMHDIIARMGTIDQSCWLAEACQFLLPLHEIVA